MGDEKGPVNGMADVEKDNIGAEPSVAGGVKPWLEYEEEWKAETEKAKKIHGGDASTETERFLEQGGRFIHRDYARHNWLPGEEIGPLGHINYGPPAFSLRIFHP
jgi:hypothetical protein